jgi:translation elongation factor EF-G
MEIEFKKKDLIDFLIIEINDLIPKNFYYKFYYITLLEVIENNRTKGLTEIIDMIKDFIIKKYNQLQEFINYTIDRHVDSDTEDENEDEDEDEKLTDEDKEKIGNEFKDKFINKINECDLNIIEQFMHKEMFEISKEIIQKRLKRHIIVKKIKKNNSIFL